MPVKSPIFANKEIIISLIFLNYGELRNNIYLAYVPDLPSCIAVVEIAAEVKILIQEAIEFYLESLQEDGEQIPLPTK
ncbi:MAG: type II toxin-antitoxin system HicB family antitoxin [Xenococcaceae cyanobacterium MO_167.B52]|nr:type II toxin-antitoxin system HicB family antitoxin [Xenococcaceae cyanobacterium MO_167.B52]